MEKMNEAAAAAEEEEENLMFSLKICLFSLSSYFYDVCMLTVLNTNQNSNICKQDLL
jgi:hypothetical protein